MGSVLVLPKGGAVLRRNFLRGVAGLTLASAATRRALGAGAMNHRERVDRVVAGADVDRPPFTFWHHFGLKTAEEHAARTLDFHRRYRTDLVKVMSDFPYPKPDGEVAHHLDKVRPIPAMKI